MMKVNGAFSINSLLIGHEKFSRNSAVFQRYSASRVAQLLTFPVRIKSRTHRIRNAHKFSGHFAKNEGNPEQQIVFIVRCRCVCF